MADSGRFNQNNAKRVDVYKSNPNVRNARQYVGQYVAARNIKLCRCTFIEHFGNIHRIIQRQLNFPNFLQSISARPPATAHRWVEKGRIGWATKLWGFFWGGLHGIIWIYMVLIWFYMDKKLNFTWLVNDYLWIPGLVNIQKNDGKIHHAINGKIHCFDWAMASIAYC